VLMIYGDFNCPFSAVASVRADALLAGGTAITWRAVQHDATIPSRGDRVSGELALDLEAELTLIHENYLDGIPIALTLPPIRPNTALASAYFAAREDDAHEYRGRLFRALWSDGRDLGDPAVLRACGGATCDAARAHAWQDDFDAMARPVTPMLREDGEVSRGLAALVRLAELSAG